MRAAAPLLAVLALIQMPAHATAPTARTRVRDETVFYDVSGITTHDIAQQINLHGPGGIYRSLVAGNTKASIEWSLEMQQARGSCSLAGVDITLDVRTTLPRWTDAGRATRQVRRKWERFLERLQDHEARHRAIGIETASRVQAAALARTVAPDCMSLRAAIAAVVVNEIREGGRRNREFDTQTRHGLDTGLGLDD
ncbi:MAG: DUF922 domain-containing protein [Lysobacter sp.]|nr:MAG: DUF922 domain-containing protein [Lysobacter sp.]